MTSTNIYEVAHYLKHIQMPEKRRIPDGPYDFGDPDTVGLAMKRLRMKHDAIDNFGLFAGRYGSEYVVLVKHLLIPNAIIGAESFPSLDHLQEVWVLD